jgi:predicted alpha/beta superfamily hydrolase
MMLTPFLVAASALSSPQTAGEPSVEPFALGTEIVLHSEVLGEARHIYLYEPPRAAANRPRATLYVLDAESNFELTVGIVRAMTRAQLAPEMVVVGLVNGARREYDLSPPTRVAADRQRYGAGGADAFLSFLLGEVEPLVRARTHVSDVRVLVGHSIGGLFAMHALLQAPESFYGHVAISPSMFWDEQSMPGKLEQLLVEMDGLDEAFVFLSLANETSPGFHEAVNVFEQNPSSWLRWHAQVFPDEDHLSTVIAGTYHGLRHVFRDWDQEPLLAALDATGLAARLDKLSTRFGFDVLPWERELAETGRSAVRSGKFDEGVALLELGIRRHPRSLVLHNYLGQAWQMAGERSQARAIYETSRAIAEETGSPMLDWVNRRLRELDE